MATLIMGNAIVKFWHLNRMGRLEGAPMAGLLLLVGAVLGAGEITLEVGIAAFAMAALTMNYVYLVNGVTDVEEDRINSPKRPIPSGDVTLREGTIYVNILLALSIMYPFWVHNTWFERGMVWLIVLMGVTYSNPPIRFKRWAFLATVYLVINFNLPIIIGHQMSGAPGDFPPYLFASVALFVANMPLKDIGDAEGDAAIGIKNWATMLGQGGLMALAAGLSVAGALASVFVLAPLGSMRFFYSAFVLLPALNVLAHVLLGLDRDELFTRGVRGLLVVSIIGILIGVSM